VFILVKLFTLKFKGRRCR